MIADIITIIRENWLLLLIGQYPNGPLGGFAATLILSVLSILLAFPLSILIALARLSKSPFLLWPSTALVYIARGVPLLQLARRRQELERAVEVARLLEAFDLTRVHAHQARGLDGGDLQRVGLRLVVGQHEHGDVLGHRGE